MPPGRYRPRRQRVESSLHLMTLAVSTPVAVVGGIVVALFAIWAIEATYRLIRDRRRMRSRHARAAGAAGAAAVDDPSFAPEALEARAREIWEAFNEALRSRDLTAVRERHVSPTVAGLLAHQFELEAETGQAVRVRLVEDNPLEVRLMDVANRDGAELDRVVLQMEARVKQSVLDVSGGDKILKDEWYRVLEYYVLGRRPGADHRWYLVDQIAHGEGWGHMDTTLIVDPAGDVARLVDATLQELAAPEVLAERLGELVAGGADAAAACGDLSLLDARFAPPVLEASVRTILRAWENAMVHPTEETALLALRDGAKYIARTPELRTVLPSALDPAATPLTLVVDIGFEAHLTARAILSDDLPKNSDGWRYKHKARWTLALSDERGRPWRLVAADAPQRDGLA